MRLALLGCVLVGCAACTPYSGAATDGPFREEFLAACTTEPNNVPNGFTVKGKITPEQFCNCMYNTTMQGLTEQEKLVAVFYLLGQSGVDVQSKREFKSMDPMAISGGAAAVGKAVNRCKGNG